MITAVAVEIKRKANKTGNEAPGSGHRNTGIKIAESRASESREPDFRNGAKKQRPLRFTPETASIHSITIQLLKRYAGSSHLST